MTEIKRKRRTILFRKA